MKKTKNKNLKDKVFKKKPLLTESFIDDITDAGIEIVDADDESLPDVPFTLDIYITYKTLASIKDVDSEVVYENFKKKWPVIINKMYSIVDNSIIFDDVDEPEYNLNVTFIDKKFTTDNDLNYIKAFTKNHENPIDDIEDKYDLFRTMKHAFISVTGDSKIFYQKGSRTTARSIEKTVRAIVNLFPALGLREMSYSFDMIYEADEEAMKYVPEDYQQHKSAIVPIKAIDNLKVYFKSQFSHVYDLTAKNLIAAKNPEVFEIPVDNNEIKMSDIFVYPEQKKESPIKAANVRSQVVLYRVTDNHINLHWGVNDYTMNVYFTASNLNKIWLSHSVYQNDRTANAIKAGLKDAVDIINEKPDDIKYRCLYSFANAYSVTENPNDQKREHYVVYLTNVVVVVEDLLFVLGFKTRLTTNITKLDNGKFSVPSRIIPQLAYMCSINARYTGNTDLAGVFSDMYDIPESDLLNDEIINGVAEEIKPKEDDR